MGQSGVVGFLKELRRRRVFRVAGLYVVGVWLVMQVADIVFPAWGIPDAAIRNLLWAALLGFPVALAFGWVFQITPEGIRRTRPEWSDAEIQAAMPLGRFDFLLLAFFIAVIAWIGYDAAARVLGTAPEDGPRPAAAEVIANSVAVLPFDSLSSDPEHEYFAAGISDEILSRLSGFAELKVIARTSSFAFKDSGYDIARIGALLGVKYILQGSVRRDGRQLRITTQLVDNAGVQVWSDSFDRELGGVFALQDEIADAVAGSIAPQIARPAMAKREPDLEAYQEYLVGKEILARRTSLFPLRSAERFTRAIELDPGFAEPYAERAIARAIGTNWARDLERVFELVQQDIDQAIALDPGLARAHAAQAILMEKQTPDAYVAREAALRKALAADPNMVDALHWLANTLREQGRESEAHELLLRAARVDPLAPSVNANLAWSEASRGQFEIAERRLLRQLEIPQPSVAAFIRLAELYQWTGRMVEAIEIAKRLALSAAAATGKPGGLFVLIDSYAMLGDWSSAQRWLERYEQAWGDLYQLQLMRYSFLAGLHTPRWVLDGMRGVLEVNDLDLSSLPAERVLDYGVWQALAGDYQDAIGTLEPVIVAGDLVSREINASQALAWAYVQSDARQQAADLLGRIDGVLAQRQADGTLHLSRDIMEYSRNAALSGDRQRALELLGVAVEAGWRDYYSLFQDPRWEAVRHDPRFEQLLAGVMADLDAQRARVEELDAGSDFAASLEAAIALHQGEPGRQ